MNTKLISEKALAVIDQYLHFTVGKATCSIPYYNNRNLGARAKLGAQIGKGSPKDIFDEIESVLIKEKIDSKNLSGEQLKKIMVDNGIGIDCSGLAYYILNAENENRKKGSFDRHLSYPFCKGIIGKIRCKLRPIENTSVATLAHNKNSRVLKITEVEPGDMITMISNDAQNQDKLQRNHILIIHQIEYQNFSPVTLHYTHAISWPSDGEYGHGVRQGNIDIVNLSLPLAEQRWIENEKEKEENYTLSRAKESVTELRRLNWL